MRDIKFRVWNPTTNRMIKIGDRSNDTALWIDENGFYVMDHFTGKPEAIGDKIDGLELMQYVGLKDKNGVEIYESDIVKIHIGHQEWLDKTMVVQWIDGAFCLHIPGLEKVTSLIFYADGVQVRRGHRNIGQFIEVIGNIYENPSLLEEVK